MTISEIENTLQILIKRHPDLNEAMLIKLLTAGGWENRMIRDAVSLFKSDKGINILTKGVEDVVSLPEIKEEKYLPEVVDSNHDLLDRNPGAKPEEYFQEKTKPEPEQEHVIEPLPEPKIEPKPEMEMVVKESLLPEKKEVEIQSLIVPKSTPENYPRPQKVDQELPHNLPILPFEDTKKAWTFSKYMDMFYEKLQSITKRDEVDEDKNAKAETKSDKEAKQKIKEEIKEELKKELKLDEEKPVAPVISKEEIKEELKKELKLEEEKNAKPVISKEEIKEELKRELKLDEVKPVAPVVSKEEIKEEIKKELKLDELKNAQPVISKEEIKEEIKKELKLEEIKSAPPVVVKEEPVKNIQITERRIVVDNLHISKTPLSKKDEKLILVTGVMLILIIILLSYMYSNGRI